MRNILLVGALAMGLAATACSRPKDTGASSPKEKANLPTRPNLAAKSVAEKFPDGTWSVEGLLKKARDLVNKEVTVRGFVVQADLCKPDAPCSVVPSVTLVDDLSNAKRRLVVVGSDRAQDLSGLAVKSPQTLTGKMAMWSPDGRMINMDGILVLNPPAPPADAAATAQAGSPPAASPAVKK
jgi:hypothetical protein